MLLLRAGVISTSYSLFALDGASSRSLIRLFKEIFMPESQNDKRAIASSTLSSTRQHSLLHNRDYMIIWSGQLVSAFGSRITIFAAPLLIVALTGSPALAGLLSALGTLPGVVLSLPAGALIDRWNRKWVMIICDCGRAIAIGSIPIAAMLGHLTMFHLALAILLEGILTPFFAIAQSASLPRIVEKEQLPQAVAQNQVLVASSQLLGPALGGLCYGLNQACPFLADGISYAISAFSLCFVKRPLQGESRSSRQNLKAEIAEGITWLWYHPILRSLTILHWALLTPTAGWILLYEQLAQHLHATTEMMGLIIACCGFGNVVGSLLTRPSLRRFSLGQVLFVTIWLWVLSWLPLVIMPNLLWFGIVNVSTFIIASIYLVAQSSYQLSLIPDHLQGRANSVIRMLITGSQPLGIVLTGLLIQFVGPTGTVLLLFVPQFLLAIVVTLSYHKIFTLTEEKREDHPQQ
jgi:MFS family permease